VGNHIHRCSYCQDACPLNESLTPREHVPFELEGPKPSPELIPLMLGDDALLNRSLPAFVMSAGADAIRGNIAIALGNIGDPAGIPALMTGLRSAAKRVRSHSAWALGAIGGAEASRELARAVSSEEDPEVREEIQSALAAAQHGGSNMSE
jgi:epoxyqueuosine reductase